MMGKNYEPWVNSPLIDPRAMETQLIKSETQKTQGIEKGASKQAKIKRHENIYTNLQQWLSTSRYGHIGKVLGVATYFARPYTSENKGTVENRMGQLRRV